MKYCSERMKIFRKCIIDACKPQSLLNSQPHAVLHMSKRMGRDIRDGITVYGANEFSWEEKLGALDRNQLECRYQKTASTFVSYS